ncbi:putative metalloprotease CJM1_0395 family protein [Stappia stellulata]|uniref:putative metalloprotease CJM1_0395 family protein n=1 Tax=Stappia stellulata TaxID=71235 RepID=UPI0003FBCC83|nr:putative metalloprotease CJM1_0395 family protein [Stappia stellulata]
MFAGLHSSGSAVAQAATRAARAEPSAGAASGAEAAERTRAPSSALAGGGGDAVTAVATLRSDAVAALQAGDASARARKDERDPAAPQTSALEAQPALEDDEDEDDGAGAGEDLSPEEETQVRDLKKRDAEVKQHEQAHASVGGPYAGSPSYEYTRGPDGKRYAVSGEVPIDASAEREPEQTIRKMEIVIRAALAPAEPSPQDRQVAAQASQQRSEAQAELQKQRAEEQDGGDDAAATGLGAKPASARAEEAPGAQAAEARRQAGAAVAAYRASEAATADLFARGANGGRVA